MRSVAVNIISNRLKIIFIHAIEIMEITSLFSFMITSFSKGIGLVLRRITVICISLSNYRLQYILAKFLETY